MKTQIPDFINELNQQSLSIYNDREFFLYLNRIVSLSYSALVLDSVLKKGPIKTRNKFDTNYVTTFESVKGLDANPNATIILKRMGIVNHSVSSNYYANLDKFPFSLPDFYLENLMSTRDDLEINHAISLLSGDHPNNLSYWNDNPVKYSNLKNSLKEYIPLFSENINDSKKLMGDIRKMSALSMDDVEFFKEENIIRYLNLSLASYLLLGRPIVSVSENLQQKIYEFYKPEQLKK